MASGFVRAAAKTATIANGYYSGTPSLDLHHFDNVPIPPGALLLVGEDVPRSRANTSSQLIRCFMAQAVEDGQRLLYISDFGDDFVSSLPCKATTLGQRDVEQRAGEKMSIAWRYKHLQISDELPASSSGGEGSSCAFDLSTKSGVSCTGVKSMVFKGGDQKLAGLMGQIKAEISSWNGKPGRLILHSFASPFGLTELPELEDLLRFVYKLRLLSRSANIVTLLSTPVHRPLYAKCLFLADSVLELQSLPAHLAKQLDIDGFMKLVRPLVARASIRPCIPESTAMAYKVRRRRLTIEPFHLPPELDNEDHAKLVCASGKEDMLAKVSTSALEF